MFLGGEYTTGDAGALHMWWKLICSMVTSYIFSRRYLSAVQLTSKPVLRRELLRFTCETSMTFAAAMRTKHKV